MSRAVQLSLLALFAAGLAEAQDAPPKSRIDALQKLFDQRDAATEKKADLFERGRAIVKFTNELRRRLRRVYKVRDPEQIPEEAKAKEPDYALMHALKRAFDAFNEQELALGLNALQRKILAEEDVLWKQYRWEHPERKEFRGWCAGWEKRYRDAKTPEAWATVEVEWAAAYGEKVWIRHTNYEGTQFWMKLVETRGETKAALGVKGRVVRKAKQRRTLKKELDELEKRKAEIEAELKDLDAG